MKAIAFDYARPWAKQKRERKKNAPHLLEAWGASEMIISHRRAVVEIIRGAATRAN